MRRPHHDLSELSRRQRLLHQALELWEQGTMCTLSIAQTLGADETEICHIITEAEGRAPKFAEEPRG